MTLKFNNRLSITPVEEGGGSGRGVKTITATNKTGAAVSSGDKVWVSDREFTGSKNTTTISYDYIASNFDSSNGFIGYSWGSLYPLDLTKPWEFKCNKVFRNDVDYGDQQNAFIYSAPLSSEDSLYAAGFCLFADTRFSFYLNTTEGRKQLSGGTVNMNTGYWIRCGWTGTEYYLDYSTDGETYTTAITYQSTSPITMSVRGFLIGYSQWIPRFYWKGTIDLKEMSMTVDNTVVWRGVSDISPKLVTFNNSNYFSNTGIAKENIVTDATGNVAIIDEENI